MSIRHSDEVAHPPAPTDADKTETYTFGGQYYKRATADASPVLIGGAATADMSSAIYDPGGLAVDVYDKANETGIEQITGPILSPATLTADVDNYEPAGFGTANMIRQNTTSNNVDISGMAAPSVGVNRIVRITNISTTGDNIRFQNNNAGSLEANRFLLRDDANRSIQPNECTSFWYDHISQRWRVYSMRG